MADMSMASLEDYSKFVDDQFELAQRGGERAIFTNFGASHARIIITQLLTRASDSIDIFSGCLSEEVYDVELLRSAAKRIGPDKFRIVVEDASPNGETSIIASLKSDLNDGSIRILQLNHEFRASVSEKANHFVVCDKRWARVEDDHDDRSALVVLSDLNGRVIHSCSALFDVLLRNSHDVAKAAQGI
jgi:hypothetical protein